MWSQVADYVTVSAPAVTYNYLRYDTTVDQTHEIIEVELTFPQGQINTPFVSAGIVSHWNGADPANGASEVYITFQYNNVTGVGNARMIVETHGGSFTQANIPQINLGQTYTLRIVKNLQQTVVYLDDVQIMTDLNSGSIPGNYIGLFALGATVQFKNFTSCSYSTPVGVFAVH
jgi:hypothetical protein